MPKKYLTQLMFTRVDAPDELGGVAELDALLARTISAALGIPASLLFPAHHRRHSHSAQRQRETRTPRRPHR